jgi:hypothetical protein
VSEFDPERLLGTLVQHGVRFVVVGGFAAVAHGSPLPTYDVDVTPERTRSNLERLVLALTDLQARIRTEGEPQGLPFRADADLLLGVTVLNLVTRLGELDLVLRPAGELDYDELASSAVHVVLGGVPVDLASLEHVIRSKAAAGRAKDRAALPVLRALQERQRPLS